MKPATFDYHAPHSLAEALALLREHGDEAKLLAGGQSLVPMMNFRLAQPAVLVDLNRLPGLNGLREREGALEIGALTRLRRLERSPEVAARWPILAEALGHVGHAAIRNRGTAGGSLAHGDPAAELATVLLALDATVSVVGPQAERQLAVAELLAGAYTVSLAADELITAIHVPALPTEAGWAFAEFSRRHGDFALVCVAAVVALDESGKCRAVRVSLGGVAGTPVRAAAAEHILVDAVPTPERIAEAAATAADLVTLESELHASQEYRRHLATVDVRRALERALARCGGPP